MPRIEDQASFQPNVANKSNQQGTIVKSAERLRAKPNQPLRERIMEQLREDIVTHRLNAGEQLQESQLATRFEVSRTPIREALQQLEREGIVEYTRNVGAVVKKITISDIGDLFEIAAVLECHAVKLVSERGVSEGEASLLRELHSEMLACAHRKDFIAWEAANRNFHDFFLDNCGNQALRDIVNNLRNKMYMANRDKLPLAIHVDDYMHSHVGIVEAVIAGKIDRAGQLMNEHIHDIKNNLIGRREQSGI